jgi:hypothetical protein
MVMQALPAAPPATGGADVPPTPYPMPGIGPPGQGGAPGMALPPAPGQGGGPTSPFAPVGSTAPATPPQAPPGPMDAQLGAGTRFGGQTTVNAQAGPADYQGVQGFADQALEQSRRYLDPQQEQQNRRMQQDLINKGIDPMSEQGRGMLDQMGRQQADQNSKAAFDALQFGQGIQQQMFGQDMARTQQAGQMQQALWQAQLGKSGQDLQRYGMNQQFELGKSGQDLQRYGMDQQYGLGMGQLDMARQGQDFNQMLGLEGLQFRDRVYGDKRSDYQDALTMSLLGMTPVPGSAQFDPSGLAGTMMGNSAGGGLIGGLLG